jgi:hypothetical protein
MSQFYLTAKGDEELCQEAKETGEVLTVTATNDERGPKTYRGVITALEQDQKTGRWLVTMHDQPPR